jgi:hypothetical protein
MDNQQLKETIREEIKNEILSKLNVYLSTEPAGFGRTKAVVTITYDGLKVCDDDAYIIECI